MTVAGMSENNFELAITTRVLGEQVMLAAAGRPAAATDRNPMRYELHTSPVLLTAMPSAVEIAGAGVESYTITLTFSDGAATARHWRVTVERPAGVAPGASWRVTVPFDPALD